VDDDARIALEELDQAACAMITKALSLARYVTIVTNAESDWVESSASKFLPKVASLLHRLEVVSARSKHERLYPGSTDVWKRVEFQERIESLAKVIKVAENQPQDKKSTQEELFGVEPLLQVISIGDSEYERAALWAVKSDRPDILVKSVKLLNAPTVVALRQQLNTVTTSFESIVASLESLDLKLHAGKTPAA
jgi:hypothetical protein